MKIDLELTEFDCEELLRMNDYVTEDITAYYYANTDPYNEVNNPDDLRGINIKIAYHKTDRPKELEKKHPMLNIMKEHAYGNVINILFASRLKTIIFKDFYKSL